MAKPATKEIHPEVQEVVSTAFHCESWEKGCAILHSDADKGLTSEQVAAKLNLFGRNELTPPPQKPWWCKLLEHIFGGFFAMLLWAAGILCFIAFGVDQSDKANLWLGCVLVFVVTVTGIVSHFQDARAVNLMNQFKDELPSTCSVLRDGQPSQQKAQELVPGDILQLKYGDKIPADIRFITADDVQVDNSSLTGESEGQGRDNGTVKLDPSGEAPNVRHATNVGFFGTSIINGTCKAVVIATGDNTYMGKIANQASSQDKIQTPISIEIEHFVKIVSYVAIFLGVTFLVIGFVIGVDPVANMVFAIGIIVANVPEGLLATVTISLSLTAQRMHAKKVLVKNLESVETLGSTTVIASDKTGTLTRNKMTVSHVWYDLSIKKTRPHDVENYQAFGKADSAFLKLRDIATLCNTAIFYEDEDAKTGAQAAKPGTEDAGAQDLDLNKRKIKGDASESAFVTFTDALLREKEGYGIEQHRDNNPLLAAVPFSSVNKYQVAINQVGDRAQVLIKGAPERIWNRCDRILINGEERKIDDAIAQTYKQHLREIMFKGERVLGFAYSDNLTTDKYPKGYEFDKKAYNFPMGEPASADCADSAKQKLCFVGLISLVDPPRAAVPSAVRLCGKAGIQVIMVTGDHPDTAAAIAKEVGIVKGFTRRDLALQGGCFDDKGDVDESQIPEDDPRIEAIVVTGDYLERIGPQVSDTPAEKQQKAKKVTAFLQKVLDYSQIVFARTSPTQKLIIVQNLQNKTKHKPGTAEERPVKHVVAVTGDGVNDSPALRAANIGIAMNIAGTDVAKSAADMVLLNDNFASIVDGVEEGRLIFDNLKKSIAYTLSSNIPEISPFLVFIVTAVPLPLPTVLILCIDLGTDMVPAISLAYENKEANIMEKPPRDSATDRLVTRKMISFSYLQIGIIQALAGFFTYVIVLNDYGFHPSVLPGASESFNDGTVNCTDTTLFDEDTFTCANGELPKLYNKGNSPIDLQECNIKRTGVCWNPEEALAHAQAAFFISIIVVQWSDLVACKTRWLSLKQQGMRNSFMNFGLFFETALGAFLCYTPGLNTGIGTRPISFQHWLPAIPFAIVITSYDETRKWLMRNLGEENWLKRFTYY